MSAPGLIRVAILGVLAASCHSGASPAVAPIGKSNRAGVVRELSPAARLARANERLEMSAYREAEADFRALRGTAQAARAAIGLGQVLVTTGRYAEALSVLSAGRSQPDPVA